MLSVLTCPLLVSKDRAIWGWCHFQSFPHWCIHFFLSRPCLCVYHQHMIYSKSISFTYYGERMTISIWWCWIKCADDHCSLSLSGVKTLVKLHTRTARCQLDCPGKKPASIEMDERKWKQRGALALLSSCHLIDDELSLFMIPFTLLVGSTRASSSKEEMRLTMAVGLPISSEGQGKPRYASGCCSCVMIWWYHDV